MYGFKGGPAGIMKFKYVELTSDVINTYRNQVRLCGLFYFKHICIVYLFKSLFFLFLNFSRTIKKNFILRVVNIKRH